jgi:hypothetical protein
LHTGHAKEHTAVENGDKPGETEAPKEQSIDDKSALMRQMMPKCFIDWETLKDRLHNIHDKLMDRAEMMIEGACGTDEGDGDVPAAVGPVTV